MRRYLTCILPLVLFIAATAISLTSVNRMTFLFAHASYYIILLIVILWGVTGARVLKSLDFSIANAISKNFFGIAAALLLTLIVFLTVKTDFRTLSDETNLLSVSQNMFFQKDIRNITEGKYYYDNFHPITYQLPKRPFIYPFLTSILHTLIGFRSTNGFLLNYIALFSFLYILYTITLKHTDRYSAIAALILILAYPIVPLFTACHGFDFLNAFFFYLAFTALFYYMKEPSKEKFAFIWMTFLVLANIRYESLIYFAIALIGLICFRYIRWNTIKSHLELICLTPFLLLPFLLQRVLSVGKYENPEGVALFSLKHFRYNIIDFIKTQFDFSFYLPYANILNIISMGCLLTLSYHFFNRWKNKQLSPENLKFSVIFFISYITNLFIIFCFYYGKISHPISARYFIVTFMTLALVPISMSKTYPAIFRPKYILIFSLVMFCLYHPIAIEDRFTNTLTLNREFRQARQFISTLDDNRILIIYHRPGQFAAMNHGAIKFTYANRNATSLLNDLKRGLYSDIIVMQRIQYSDHTPIDGCELSNRYALQKIDEIQVTGNFYLRISKVVSTS